MDSTERILSIVLAVVIVASTVLTPLVAIPTASAQSQTQGQQDYDFSTNESNVENTSGSDDTTKDSSSSENSSSGESTSESSTQELGLDEDGLQDDYAIQRGMDNLNIQDIKVENWNEVDGGATVEAFIVGQVPDAHYPFKYPVTVTVEALNGSGDVVATQKAQIVLRPHTKETDWSNVSFTNLDKSDLKNYSAYASTNFTFNQANSTQYTFRVKTQSRYNSALTEQTQTNLTVNGQNTENTANIDAVIQTANDYRELPTKSRVNSFKASTVNPIYMENISLPTRKMVDPSGTISQFANMTTPNKKSATISSEGGNLRVTTATEYTEKNTPQSLVIRYAMTGESDSMSVVPISAGGDTIDPDPDTGGPYELTRGSQDECIEGSVTKACIIKLSEDERNYINQHGELFLSFESDQSTEAQILCQSVIGGGLNTADSNVCGIKSLSDGASPVYKPTITDFSVVPSGNTNLLDEGNPVEMQNRDPGDFELGIVVKNTGTAPLEGDEPLQVFQNSTFDTPSEETITKTAGTDYNANLDNQTVTYNFSRRYPASNITYHIDTTTNGGVVELKIEDEDGDSIYRTYRNVDGTQEIGLSGLGGYTGSLTVTVNAIYNDASDQPTVSSMKAVAVDQASTAESELTLNDFSGGSGDLAPGDTRKHVFPSAEIDLGSVVDPAVTFKAEFGDDRETLQIQDGQPKLVADAGGPYNAQLEVDKWVREQTGYGTIVAHTQPGSQWEKGGDPYNGNIADKLTYRTTHEDVPKVNLSTQQAIQYYKSEDYIRKLEEQLPEYYQGSLDIKDIKYVNYTGDEMFFGTEQEIASASSLTYQEGNWSGGSFTGEDIQGYDKVEATMFRNSNGDLDFKTDNSDAIYFYGSGAGTLVPQVVETIEQESKPNIGQDAPECSNTNQYPCWEKGPYIGTERTTDGYTDLKCQAWENYSDPGPDWYIDSTSMSGVCWEKVNVTNDYDQYRWQLIDEVEEVALSIPQYNAYNQHSRPVYDMEIVWEQDRAESATQYIWEGPEYTVEPDTTPTTVRMNGSGSQSKSTVPIEDYQWYVNGEEINAGGLGSASTEINDTGRHEVKLVVKGGGMSDTDTTHISADVTCGELNVCSGSDHPELTLGKVTEKVDRKYQEGAIEVNLSETPNNGDRFQYRLQVDPAESAISVGNEQRCPTGYVSGSYTLPDSDNEDTLSSSPYLAEVLDNIETSRTVSACDKTDQGPASGPEAFIHPQSIDDSIDGGSVTVPLEESKEKVFWEGAGIPKGGLTQIAYVNPRFIPEVSNGFHDFEISLQVKDNESTSTLYSTVDTTTATIEFCEAKTVWECPDLNSDLDDKSDGDDQCPYIIARTQFPCEGLVDPDEDEQALVYGGPNDGWNIQAQNNYDPLVNATSMTDKAYIGTKPSHALDGNTLSDGTPYNDGTLQMFYDGQVVNDNSGIEVIAQYPLDYKNNKTGDSYKKLWTLRDAMGSYDGQAFVGGYERRYTTDRYIQTFSPLEADGERRKLKRIDGWESQNWDGDPEKVAYFTKNYAEYASSYTINLRVDREDRGGNYSLGLSETVDGITDLYSGSDKLDYYESQYGSDWEKEYKYEIKETFSGVLKSRSDSPMGNSYSLDPTGDDVTKWDEYPFFSIANHDAWPGQKSPQSELYPQASFSATTHTLHERIANKDKYDVSFWYKPELGRSSEKRYVVKRELDANSNLSSGRTVDQDVIVYVTEQDYADTDIPEDEKPEMDELYFGSFPYRQTAQYEEEDYEFIRTNTAVLPAQNGDTIKYLLWQDSDSDATEAMHVWNADGDQAGIPQSVEKSDYYIEKYNPMLGTQRKVIAQSTYKKANILYELSYVRPKNLFDSESSRDKYIDYNYGSRRLGNINESDLPFLQFSTTNRESVVRPYTDIGWRHATISMDRTNNTATYYENYGTDNSQEVTVNVANDLNNNIQNDNRLQLFMGAGWVSPSELGALRTWGGQYTGKYSDIRITDPASDEAASVDSYYPTDAQVRTSTRSVPQEDIDRAVTPDNGVDLDEVTFTRDNIRISTQGTDGNSLINWNSGNGSSKVTITAIAKSAYTEDVSPATERYRVEYYSNKGTNGSYKEVLYNGLESSKNYTDFEIIVRMDSNPSDGWTTPEVKQVNLLNYNPTVPDTPPIPTENSTLKTTGTDRTVPAPPDDGSSDDAGSVNLSGQIRYDGPSDTVPIKFIVRDNKTVIAEGTMATDVDGKVITAERSWSQLRDDGLEPREDAYLVEFVVEEDPDGLWDRRTIGIGRFIMCDQAGTIC